MCPPMIINSVSDRLTLIEKIFLTFQNEHYPDLPFEVIRAILLSEGPLFRSIAYESVSMAFANTLLSQNLDVSKWISFESSLSEKHPFHVYIGLGWALGKNGLVPEKVFPGFNPMQLELCYDGLGYYYALFRGRLTLKNQEIPDFVNDLGLSGFDQGLGRRLWYHVRGNTQNLVNFINSFHSDRMKGLWRGVGIACAYVGGCDTKSLYALKDASGKNLNDFRQGVLFSILSRMQADCIEESSWKCFEAICEYKADLLIVELNKLLSRLKQ